MSTVLSRNPDFRAGQHRSVPSPGEKFAQCNNTFALTPQRVDLKASHLRIRSRKFFESVSDQRAQDGSLPRSLWFLLQGILAPVARQFVARSNLSRCDCRLRGRLCREQTRHRAEERPGKESHRHHVDRLSRRAVHERVEDANLAVDRGEPHYSTGHVGSESDRENRSPNCIVLFWHDDHRGAAGNAVGDHNKTWSAGRQTQHREERAGDREDLGFLLGFTQVFPLYFCIKTLKYKSWAGELYKARSCFDAGCDFKGSLPLANLPTYLHNNN